MSTNNEERLTALEGDVAQIKQQLAALSARFTTPPPAVQTAEQNPAAGTNTQTTAEPAPTAAITAAATETTVGTAVTPAAAETQTAPATGQDPVQVQATTTELPAATTGGEVAPATVSQEQPATATAQQQPQAQADSENGQTWANVMDFLGRYGMAVGGALLITISAVWGLIYVYQYIGPEVKLAAGGLLAAALIVFGERKSRDERLVWWAQAIIGSGYAVAYFLVYAAHQVPSLKVLDSPLVDSCLLLLLAGAGGAHAVWRKSQPIALLSIILAFVTISFSQVTQFSVLASGLLLTGLVGVIWQMRWYGVYVVGMIASYATFMFFTQPQVMASSTTALQGLLLSASFLSVYWVAFNLISLLLQPAKNSERYTVLAVVIGNAVAFLLPTMYQLGDQFPHLRWAFLLGVGVLYLFSSHVARLKRDGVLSTAMLVLGLQLITAAVPLKLDASAVTTVWLLEALALTFLGMRFNMAALRVFGLAVTAACWVHFIGVDISGTAGFTIFGLSVATRTLIGLVTIGVSAGCYGLYLAGRDKVTAWERSWTPHEHLYAGSLLLMSWLLPLLDASGSNLVVIWALEAVAFVIASKVLNNGRWALDGVIFLGSAAVASLVNYNLMGIGPVVLVCALAYGLALVYRFNLFQLASIKSELPWSSDWLRLLYCQAYQIAGTALVYLHIMLRVSDPYTASLLYSGAGIALIAAGFLLKDTFLRMLGAVGFAATLAQLYYTPNWHWAPSLTAVALMAVTAVAYRVLRRVSADAESSVYGLDWLKTEPVMARTIYPIVASILLAVTFSRLLSPAVAPLWLGLEAVVLVMLGTLGRETVLRLLGTGAFIWSSAVLVHGFQGWGWFVNLGVVAAMVLSSVAYRLFKPVGDGDEVFDKETAEGEVKLMSQVHALAAALLLALTSLHLLSAAELPIVWALEGIALVAISFIYRTEIYLRAAGLIMFISLISKLLVVDLWHATTGTRILSTFAAGILTLAAAYAFFRFGRSEPIKPKNDEQAGEQQATNGEKR